MLKLNLKARIIIVLASLSLIVAYFVPVWVIYLFAPQYPEGLTMNIWLTRLSGDIDIINGLNHYIGMKHIKAEMFPEFSFLIYVVAFFILMGLLVAYVGNTRFLFWYLVFTVFCGVFAMFDFYRWGYEYGHNLDENAAIKVPGLSYQPPLLGHKRLLNFDAYSYPSIGGWVVIIAAGLMGFIWFSTLFNFGKKLFVQSSLFTAVAIILFLSSCQVEPEPIKPGLDSCSACKMSIMDIKFAAEIITKKGKIIKFDDVGCLSQWLKKEYTNEADCKRILVSQYTDTKNWLDVQSAVFIQSESIHSPMNYNFAAFKPDQNIESVLSNETKKKFSWQDIKSMAL